MHSIVLVGICNQVPLTASQIYKSQCAGRFALQLKHHGLMQHARQVHETVTYAMRPLATGSLSIAVLNMFCVMLPNIRYVQTVCGQASKMLQQSIIFALFAHVFAATADVIRKECQLQCKTCKPIQS